VITLWVLFLVVGVLFAPRLQEVFEREFVTGNTGDSQVAADIIAEEFTQRSPFQEQLVLSSDSWTVDDPRYRQAAEGVIGTLEDTGLVTGVSSYFSTGDGRLVSPDGRTTYATVDLRSRNHSDGMATAGELLDALSEVQMPEGFDVSLTGLEVVHADITEGSRQSLARAEAFGLPVALVVLIIVFGALVAATLPLLLGVLSIVIALALAFLVGQLMDLSVFLETFVSMLGLGVGIDYALFILTRYRAERRAGREIDAAVVETVTHAGKAIAFSGLTVIIGLSALLATDEPTVISIGIGGILVVLVAVAAALTLMPANVAVLGDRLEAPRSLTRLLDRTHRGGFWHRWATHVMHRPVRYAVLGLVIVAAASWSTFGMERGSLGVKLLSTDFESRQGYEMVAEAFGPGLTSPVQIVVRSEQGIDDPQVLAGIDRLTTTMASDSRFVGAMSITSLAPDVTLEQYQAMYAADFAGLPEALRGPVGQFVNLDRGGDTTVILGFLAADPGSQDAWDTVGAVRDEIIPTVSELEGATVLVGGTSAIEKDASEALYDRVPLVIGLILGATFLLLMILFRSILIPVKAVIMNLLSVFAAYGLLVLVFQKGYGDSLLGFESIGSVNWVTPVLLFAVLFGLSMDYEVFLMSRIRELHDRGHSNEESVAVGLERTGGVITGAAAIMVVVFGAYVLSDIIVVKELGFALAVAVAIDATLIRVILVPATMRLMGEWNWWLPRWLGRILPKIELEKEVTEPEGQPVTV
jgi:RND superfamily putative drug exporter